MTIKKGRHRVSLVRKLYIIFLIFATKKQKNPFRDFLFFSILIITKQGEQMLCLILPSFLYRRVS